MSDSRELYQQLIIDHGRKPRNFGVLATATHIKQGFNPLCGDKLTLYIEESDGQIKDIRFDGEGCAISLASASMMTDALIGKSLIEADKLFVEFHQLVTQRGADVAVKSLGKLVVLKGVSEYPARVKCATLAWQTLRAVLQGEQGNVSTEA